MAGFCTPARAHPVPRLLAVAAAGVGEPAFGGLFRFVFVGGKNGKASKTKTKIKEWSWRNLKYKNWNENWKPYFKRITIDNQIIVYFK